MGYSSLSLFGILFGIFYCSNLAFAATTLESAFQSALAKSETLASQDRQVRIAEEKYSQARGNILPSLNFNASYLIQASPSNPLAESFFPRYQPEVKLTLKQPLFRGLREFAALGVSNTEIQFEQLTREDLARTLYTDVAKSYHAVLAAEENFYNISEQLKIYEERIDDLTRRVRQGTSNQTDLLALQSSRASVQSQLQTVRGTIAAARESFAFNTGLPVDTQLMPLKTPPPNPKAVEEYLKGIDQRPDVLLLVQRTEIADKQVDIAKGGHAPTVDFLGNYYLRRQSSVYDGINWDVQAALSFPLYAGGMASAAVRESSLLRERAELKLARLRRESQQKIRTLYSEYTAGRESITALEESLKLSEKQYQLLKSDFRRGLSRNLDVLQALVSTHTIRQELLKARFAVRDKWVELSTAAGHPPFDKGT